MNRDNYGIIGQITPSGYIEGGDSLAFTGHWLYLNSGKDPGGKVVTDSKSFAKFFSVSFGAYVRHPDPLNTTKGFGTYYKSPWQGCISRDQFTGLLLGLISGREYLELVKVMLHWSLRGFLFAYSTIDINDGKIDTSYWPGITGPDIWATALRGLGILSYIFWPLLCILDLHTLINAIIHNNKKEDDVISFTGKLLVSNDIVPTPISKLAYKIVNKEQLLEELHQYWCTWRDNCDFYHAFKRRLNE